MKFTCTVDIDLPLDRVVELYNNPDNMKYWQDGFISFEHVNGEPGKAGAQSHITYKMGKKEMVLLETIVKRELPHTFNGTYEGDFGKNTMNNTFSKLSDNKTRWRADLEYLQANGFILKVMTKLFPGIMKKQTQKWSDQFKAWAENQAQ